MKNKSVISLLLIFLLILSFIIYVPFVAYAEDNDILEQISKMYNLREIGKYEECIKIADSILAEDNTFMEAYYNKSIACFYLNKPAEALEVLQKQLKLNPKNSLALYNAACASSMLGKSDQAVEYLKQLLAQDIYEKKDIAKDKDFDSIRQTEAYKKIMGLSIVAGGEILNLDLPVINKDGSNMLPLRAVFEALGAQITWNDETKTVTAIKGKITTSITINKKTALVNGKTVEMSIPAINQGGITYIPLRFASEALGAKVNWDPEGQIIEILISAPEGDGNNYESIKNQLDSLTVVSVIDGIWPEPYCLTAEEGTTLIIAKDKKALDLMNSLDSVSRAKYMYQTTYDNFALVVGCEPVHMKFILDGKVYYAGDMYYGKEGEDIELIYYEKGLPINVVKQYESTFNYKDYYLLPESEKTTSKIGD